MKELLLLTGPGTPNKDDDDARGADQGNHGQGTGRRRSSKPSIPSHDDCLKALGQLPGMIVMGILTPSQGNAIRSCYQEIIKSYQQQTPNTKPKIDNSYVLDLLQKDPQLLNLLEPLLTHDQIDLIMRGNDREERKE